MGNNLFFALEIHAPWPESFPKGRLIQDKHLTLAFLGKIEPFGDDSFPLPCLIGPTGFFNECLFLPPAHPHVVAWNMEWLTAGENLFSFREKLLTWLKTKNIEIHEKRPFLSHVTIARDPFSIASWKKAFSSLPFFGSTIHLYQSLEHSQYVSLWHRKMLPPFEEIEHTADIAYLVRGQNLTEIYLNAFIALCFSFPPCIPYLIKNFEPQSLAEIIHTLNQIVAKADAEIGCPFKAVSYHGQIHENKDHLTWEMIIDV